MKKHISIFAFLLSAFATGLAFEVRADQTVDGGHCYFGEAYQSEELNKRMSVTGLDYRGMLGKGKTATCTASQPDGMKIVSWGVVEKDDSSATLDIMEFGTVDWKSDVLSEYKWTNEHDKKYVAIAVRFDYIKYNVVYDANGGAPKPTSLVNQSYDLNITLAAKPTKTGYTFNKWKASSNGGLFGAGSSVNGSSLGLADCHVDGSNVTMTAQWAANDYSIGCELANGSWPADYAPPARAVYDKVFSLPAPTRIGYDFIGWKVTSGLDTTTAKWGTGENPSTSIAADTLCVNGDKEVYFKNLNPTDNATVKLTAQWQAKTIRVTFNNEGGSSGGGILDYLDVTYGNAYPALNVPSQGGKLFRGYVIDGTEYWNEKAQPTKPTWDIPTNCTAHAQWEKVDYQLIYDENRSDGSVSKQVSRTFEYGVPTVLYDGADFSNLGCTLLGWSTLKQAEKPDDGCEIGASKTFVSSTTLYAVWEKNYFIAYDGNGATNETPMAVQKLVFGKSGQSLNPNIYGKVGYTFYDWATNRAAALRYEKKFKDKEVLTGDFATTVGETNTLYAIWKTNTYYVAFNMNGGADVAPDVLTCAYDNHVNLTWTKKDGSAFTNGAHDFLGWSNDISKVIYTDRTASVSNLCATADGTNTLYAVWKLSPLSAAMHCDNLRWESYAYQENYAKYVNEWVPEPSGEGVSQTGDGITEQQWLVAQVPTNGILSFKWMPVGCEGQSYSLSYWITADKDNYFKGIVDLDGGDDEWHTCVISNVPAEYYVHLYVGSTSKRSYCQVDQMTWTPGGPEPEEGVDNVDISSAGISADGKSFSLSFDSKAEFDYNLLTNANLLIKEGWGVMEKKTGTGEPITFEPEIIEGQPQMFYRVDTIQRK